MPKLKLAKVGALTTNDYHRFKVIEKGRTNGHALCLHAVARFHHFPPSMLGIFHNKKVKI